MTHDGTVRLRTKSRKPRGTKTGGHHEELITRLLNEDPMVRVNGHADDLRRLINGHPELHSVVVYPDDYYNGAVTWIQEVLKGTQDQSNEDYVVYYDHVAADRTRIFGGRLPDAHKIQLVDGDEFPKIQIDWYEVEINSFMSPHKWADVAILLLGNSMVDGEWNRVFDSRVHLIDRYFNKQTIDRTKLRRVLSMLEVLVSDCHDIDMWTDTFPRRSKFNAEFRIRLSAILSDDPDFENEAGCGFSNRSHDWINQFVDWDGDQS